jgi:hypothetical protein
MALYTNKMYSGRVLAIGVIIIINTNLADEITSMFKGQIRLSC